MTINIKLKTKLLKIDTNINLGEIKMKNIFIGGAWPYANNSLHIGHLAALLPGDVLARFFRKNGNTVFYVSGSDCHGTPITDRKSVV